MSFALAENGIGDGDKPGWSDCSRQDNLTALQS